MASLANWYRQEPVGTLRSAQMGDKETAGQSGLELAIAVSSSPRG